MSEADRVKVTSLEVRGRRFDVYAHPRGYWSADFDAEKTITADTQEQLRSKLMEATRKAAVKLDVRFVSMQAGRHGGGSGGQRGRVYGIHGGTGNLMVEWEGGSKEQLSYHPAVLPDLDDAELDRYRRLLDAQHTADRRVRAFEQEHEVQLTELMADQFAEQVG